MASLTCSNLLSLLIRCGTKPYEWDTQWRLLRVYVDKDVHITKVPSSWGLKNERPEYGPNKIKNTKKRFKCLKNFWHTVKDNLRKISLQIKFAYRLIELSI